MKLARIPLLGLAALTITALPLSLDAAPSAPAAPQHTCKTYGAGKCCSPEVTNHLAKEAIFAACGESEATLIGEAGSTDTCKYHFKVPGENAEDTFVQIYAPTVKEVPQTPTDPFMSFKKVGRVWVTDKAKSPKAAPILANATGLWLPGKGFFVSVNAKTKVCTKTEAITLSKSMK
jgi:hypothetical protein